MKKDSPMHKASSVHAGLWSSMIQDKRRKEGVLDDEYIFKAKYIDIHLNMSKFSFSHPN